MPESKSFMKGLFLYLVTFAFTINLLKAYNSNEFRDSVFAKQQLNLADSLYHANKLDSAIIYYKNASETYQQLNDWDKVSYCEIWESYMYIDLGEYEKATTNLSTTIDFFNSFLPSNNQYSFNCSIKKIAVLFNQDKYAEGLHELGAATKLFSTNTFSKTSEGEKKLASAWFEYGNCYLELGKLDSALIMYKKTLEIRERLYEKNHNLIVDCYNNIGITYGYYGDSELGTSFMLQALHAREESKGFAHTSTAWSYTNIAISYFCSNNFDKAFIFAKKGLESRKQCLPEGHIDFASSYSVIANIYNETGNFNEAIIYHKKALAIFIDKLGENNIRVSSMYNNIADYYNKKQEYDTALIYFIKSYSLLKQASPNNIIADYVLLERNIADAYIKLHNIDSALYYNDLSIKSNYAQVIKTNKIEAILDYDFALQAYEQAAEIHWRKYKTGHDINELRFVNLAYENYMNMYEYMRSQAVEPDSKIKLSELNSPIADGLIYTTFLLNKKDSLNYSNEKLINTIDKNKAAILYEMMLKTNNSLTCGIPDSINKKLRNISGALMAHKTKKADIEERGSEEELFTINNEIFLLQKQLRTLNDFIKENYPFSNSSNFNSTKVNLDFLKEKPQLAIIEYFITDTLLYVSFIDSKGAEIRKVAIDSMFQKQLFVYVQAIKKNRINKFSSLSAYLYNILIYPVEDLLLGNTKIVIIPDKYLYYLPFETLSADVKNNDFKTKEYLITKYEISYHYSANLYSTCFARKQSLVKQTRSFVGFAPIFEANNQGVLISDNYKKSMTDSIDEVQSELLRSMTVDGKTYASLPFTKKEVNTIASMFNANKLNASKYLNAQANESNFKAVANKYSIIHIASHGLINENKPRLSGIVFYPDSLPITDTLFVNKSDRSSDVNYSPDVMFSGEMYNLNINADLVVLSACETGIGKIAVGEGVLSMTRGFIYSGASNVIFSLWKVGDKNTCDLMVDFYDAVLKGDTYAQALQKAKMKQISQDKTAFPRFWGGFTLLGVE